MRIFQFTALALAIFFMASCGPSQQEIDAKNKALIDSTKKATEEALNQKLKQEQEDKARMEKLEKDKIERNKDAQDLENLITSLETAIEVQKVKYEDLKSPKFLRTPQEKEAQLFNQLKEIKKMEKDLIGFKTILQKIKNGEDYDILPNHGPVSDTTVQF